MAGHGEIIYILRFADGIALMPESESDQQEMLSKIDSIINEGGFQYENKNCFNSSKKQHF